MAELILSAAAAAVEVSGPQAAPFLQSQVTQEVEALAVGSASRTLLLEPNGHMVAIAEIARLDPESFALITHPTSAEALASRLSRFKIRTKATIAPPYPVDLLFGQVGIASALAPGLGWRASEGGVVEESLADAVRILGRMPALGIDLDEGALPNALGDLAPYASFTKGCYTGQELVERVESRKAAPPKRLFGVAVTSGVIHAGEQLFSQHDPIGTITSVATLSESDQRVLGEAFGGYEPAHRVLAWCVLSRNRHPSEVERAGSAGAEERRVRLVELTR